MIYDDPLHHATAYVGDDPQKERFTNYFYVDYTDDAAQMQAAIDLCELNLGTLYLSAPLLLIDTPLTVTRPITIEGQGGAWEDEAGGTIIRATAPMASILEIDISEAGARTNTLTGGNYKNFLLDGDELADVGLLVTDAIRAYFEGVNAINCLVWGILDLYNHTHHYSHVHCSFNGENNVEQPPTSGGARFGTAGGAPANSLHFDNCSWEANHGCGVYLARTTSAAFYTPVIEGNYSFGLFTDAEVTLLTMINPAFELNVQVTGEVSANILDGGQYITLIGPMFVEDHATNYALDTISVYDSLIILNPYVTPARPIRVGAATGVFYVGDKDYIHDGTAGWDQAGKYYFWDIEGGGTTHGFTTVTPAFPASGVEVKNLNHYPVQVVFLTSGTATVITLIDINGVERAITTPVTPGMSYYRAPDTSISITYTVAPTWVWDGI